MKTFRFRDFQIYNDARAFRKVIKEYISRFPKDERFRLVDQIYRACQSIILNIAEGSAKKSDDDFARFLEMSIASVNELIAGFDVAKDDGYITAEELIHIEKEAEALAKKIGAFIKTLRKKPTANKQIS